MKKGIIYKYTCSVTEKVYIGQTVDEKGRKHGHMSSCWKYNSHFYLAVRKYGWKNFTYKIIFETKSKDRKKLNLLLDIMEKFYIKKYDSFKNGYNSTLGGKDVREVKKCSNPRKIGQFSNNGELISTWPSAKEIERSLNLNSIKVIQSCKGLRGFVGGYKWKFI